MIGNLENKNQTLQELFDFAEDFSRRHIGPNDYEVAHDSNDEDANIVIVNTCGFIDSAKEESVNTILEAVELKKSGDLDTVVVAGCGR